MDFKKCILLVILVLFLFSCSYRQQKIPSVPVKRAFYYWKTTLKLSGQDIDYLGSLKINRLYVRIFDIVLDAESKRVIPDNKLLVSKNSASFGEIVPVIFITQEALKAMKPEELDDFSKKIIVELKAYENEFRVKNYPEVQIDCDWTGGTKERYFSFLKYLKVQLGKYDPKIVLSVTLRLHQLKYYEKTGVPPVERTGLMLYNLHSPVKYNESNSIIDTVGTKEYLKSRKPYLLKTDIILPVYSWAVQYNSKKEFVRLYPEEDLEQLLGNKNLKEYSKDRFRATDNFNIGRKTVWKNDIIKIDRCEFSDSLKLTELIKGKLIIDSDTVVSLFHYDNETIRRFSDGKPEKIKELYNNF
ncbi:MAG: hypothetical protein A2231_06560 [Candidatus Firestonebacteria bacterium RIFOXYA2_FULL_40_8]|nr:MAG: hypothetical protein A2231_06560 [Candidatus Firestonebacteria bacterium RIFOXYA2_FULL_40_8]